MWIEGAVGRLGPFHLNNAANLLKAANLAVPGYHGFDAGYGGCGAVEGAKRVPWAVSVQDECA